MSSFRFVSLIALCMLLETAVAHTHCNFVKVSLGVTKYPSDCKDKCTNFTSSLGDDVRECVAWIHKAKSEACSGWLLDEEADDDYDYSNCYPSYYCYYYYNDEDLAYARCGLNADADVTLPNTKKKGCSFETINLGYAKTEGDCNKLCTAFKSKKYGGCVGWGYKDDDSECSGLVSEPANDSNSCGLP